MRLTSGRTVTATERWLDEIRAGRAFCGGDKMAAAAAKYSHLQLFNPAASGITVIARAPLCTMPAAQEININYYNTALATDTGLTGNLLRAGAASKAAVRKTTNAAALGTTIADVLLGSLAPLLILDQWFCELAAGEGVVIVNTTANADLTVFFSWIEV